MTMESAEEFANRLDGMIEGVDEEGVQMGPQVIAAIEADRAAMALFVLAECEKWLADSGVYEHARGMPERMIREMRARYQKEKSDG